MKPSRLRFALAPLFFCLAAGLFGQGTPECQWNATFTSQTPGAAQSNKGALCVAFRLTYYTGNATGVSIQLEGTDDIAGAPDSSGWTALTAVSGSTSPATGTTSGEANYCCDYYPWIRVNPTTLTGTPPFSLVSGVKGYNGTSAANVPAGSMVNPMTALGDMIYGAAGGAPTRLPGNTTANVQCLTQTGDGTNSGVPVWSPCPSAGQLTYYFTNTASDISTYLQATASPYSPKTTLTFSALPTGTDTLQNWATNPGIPNLSFIPAGIYTFHVHALKSPFGSANLQCAFVEVDSTGHDIAVIGVSEPTSSLAQIETEYTLEFADGNVYTMASTSSRIVARVEAVVTSGSPNVEIFVGGEADSHISLPSSTVDVTNFVPYQGATADVNLGNHNLSAANTFTAIRQISVPAAPTATVSGSGAATITYVVQACTQVGCTTPSPTLTVSSAPDPLGGSDTITLHTTADAGSDHCQLLRLSTTGTSPTTLGVISAPTFQCGQSLVDNGLAGDGYVPAPFNVTAGIFDADNLNVLGHSAFGNTGKINDESLFNGGGGWDNVYGWNNVITVQEQMTDSLTNPSILQSSGIAQILLLSPPGDVIQQVNGGTFSVITDLSNAHNFAPITSGAFESHHNGTGNISGAGYYLPGMMGIYNSINNDGAGTVDNMTGIVDRVSNNGEYGQGIVTALVGLEIQYQNIETYSDTGDGILIDENEGDSYNVSNNGIHIQDQCAYYLLPACTDMLAEGLLTPSKFQGTVNSGLFAGMGTAPGISGCNAATIDSPSTNAAGTITAGATGACVIALTWANSQVYPVCGTVRVQNLTHPGPTNEVDQVDCATGSVTLSGTTIAGDVLRYAVIGN
jgi:hypothetical protein